MHAQPGGADTEIPKNVNETQQWIPTIQSMIAALQQEQVENDSEQLLMSRLQQKTEQWQRTCEEVVELRTSHARLVVLLELVFSGGKKDMAVDTHRVVLLEVVFSGGNS